MSTITPARYLALVVDDSSIARKTVVFALTENGFECSEAIDGEDALQKLKSASYDLLVTDLCMPNKNGHSLVTTVVGSHTGLTIVVHTAVKEPRMTHDLLARGIDDVIYKPTDYAAFAVKARARVERRRREDSMRAITAAKLWDSPEDSGESSAGPNEEPEASRDAPQRPATPGNELPRPSSPSSSVRTSPKPGDATVVPRNGPTGGKSLDRSETRRTASATANRVVRTTRPRSASPATLGAAAHGHIDLSDNGPGLPSNAESTSASPQLVEVVADTGAVVSAVEIASRSTAASDTVDCGSQASSLAVERDRPGRVDDDTLARRAPNDAPCRMAESRQRDATPSTDLLRASKLSARTPPAKQPERQLRDKWLGRASDAWQKAQTRGATTWLSLAVLFGLAASLFFQIYVTRQQARAIEVLERLGAQLSRSENGDVGVDFRSRDITGAMQQLQALQGVTSVDLASSNVSDQDLERLQELGGLQVLGLDDTGVTDAGMKRLLRLRRLRQLSVNGTAVSEPQIRDLEAAIPGLTVDHDRKKRASD